MLFNPGFKAVSMVTGVCKEVLEDLVNATLREQKFKQFEPLAAETVHELLYFF